MPFVFSRVGLLRSADLLDFPFTSVDSEKWVDYAGNGPGRGRKS